jgi:hypothetical protein
MMPQFGSEVGVNFCGRPQKLAPRSRMNSKMDLERYLNEVGQQMKLDLVFIIIPDYLGGVSPYRKLKKYKSNI